MRTRSTSSMRSLPGNPERILIRSTNWIGDAVMTTPAVRTIRNNFPAAEITLLAHPWVADVFAASPRIDRIWLYEKKGQHRGITGMVRLARELRAGRFDMAILLQNAFEAAFITTLAGIPVRAGYTTDGRGLLLTHEVVKDAAVDQRHQVYYYQEMLRGLGLQPAPDRLELFLDSTALAKARQGLDAHRADKSFGPVVGLNPGAAYGPAKRWPAEKFAELARMLCERHRAEILVFGTEQDAAAAAAITAGLGPLAGHCLDLTGKTDLATALGFISLCDLFVTNDSGLMHVAAALEVPTVAIFGSTDHVATGPWSERARVIRRQDLECSPCKKSVCPKRHFACMERIGAAEVQAVAEQILAQTAEEKKSG